MGEGVWIMKTKPRSKLDVVHQHSQAGIAGCRVAAVITEAFAGGNCTLKKEKLPELVNLNFWWLQLYIVVASCRRNAFSRCNCKGGVGPR